ncbi:hypothetical protein FRB95_002044 [Tulasnella sp. JGI-2019a]|nr:hypothetical protein FRB95_002044 [Tulasnella sp. JGI-2019a]
MSTRIPPPNNGPPPYAFVGRVYRRSLRPIVMGTTIIAAMWSFVWGGEALYDLSGTGSYHYLNTINLALGILFLAIGFIELFGFFAAVKQAMPLARMYTYLSILASLIVIAAEALRFSVYFTEKSNLINACTSQATGLDVVTYGSFWGSTSDHVLTASDAQKFCQDSWTRSVWGSVAWLIISIALSVLFVSLAFAFYYQLLLPEQLAPSQIYSMNNMQNQPYNPHSGYQYPAPAGPPPSREDYVPPYDPAKVPDYYETGQGEERREKDEDAKGFEPVNLGYSGAADHRV